MATPASLIRRVEALESELSAIRRGQDGRFGREPQIAGNRWAYLAKTIKVGTDYSAVYPSSGNTFGLQFLDRQYTPSEGAQAVTEKPRSAKKQAIGRTINGQWVLEGEVVLVFPAPPPPNTTGKGRWWILAQPYYYGKLTTSLAANGSCSVKIWRPKASATWWEQTAFTLSGVVRDYFLRFADGGTTLDAGTGVRIEWVQNPVDSTASRWVVAEASCSPTDGF